MRSKFQWWILSLFAAIHLPAAFAKEGEVLQALDLSTISTTADAAQLLSRQDLPEEMAPEALKNLRFKKTQSVSFNSMLGFLESPEEIHFSNFDWRTVEFARYPENPYSTSIREPYSNENSMISIREPLYMNSDANRITLDRHPRTDGRIWDRRGDLFLLHRCRTMNIGRGQMVCVVSMHLNLQANPYRLLDEGSHPFHSANHQVIEVNLYEAN